MKIYIAGPMFIESQIEYNLKLTKEIRELGIEVYCPNENLEINDKNRKDITGEKIYIHDMKEIESSNILLCQFADCAGTMWESGYMDCLSKNCDTVNYLGVIGISTDIRLSTQPDPEKGGFDNQSMYLNQFAIGGLKLSLGIFGSRSDLYAELKKLKREFENG